MSDPANVSRRDFVKAIGAAAVVPAPGLPPARAETAVTRFFRTIGEEQKGRICFPSDHHLRRVVRNNWKVVEPTIGDMSREQQALCREIFRGLCSAEGLDRFDRQMRDDDGGFANYHVAVFGEPGTDQPFEWVLTGRHVTLRADGNHASGPSCRGPIFWGHSRGGPQLIENVWWPQIRQAAAVFAALDDGQKAQALITKAQADAARVARLRSEDAGAIGLAVSSLDPEGKGRVRKLLEGLVSPFRDFATEAITSCLDPAGGVDKLRLSVYERGEVGPDLVPLVWKLEGPDFAWFFHGSPHVHAWITVDPSACERA